MNKCLRFLGTMGVCLVCTLGGFASVLIVMEYSLSGDYSTRTEYGGWIGGVILGLLSIGGAIGTLVHMRQICTEYSSDTPARRVDAVPLNSVSWSLDT